MSCSVSRMFPFLKRIFPAFRQVSEATRRLLGEKWELEGPRNVCHPPWPDVLAYTIQRWCPPSSAASALERDQITESDELLRRRRGAGGMEALVEATGGSESALARYLPSCTYSFIMRLV